MQRLPWLVLSALCLLAACAQAPTHPGLRQLDLPLLLPARAFVADVDYDGGYRISPDGQKLLWTQVVDQRIGLAASETRRLTQSEQAFRTAARRFETGVIANWQSVGIAYNWLADSRHVMYIKDRLGDENTQIQVFDADDPAGTLHNLTPWPGARSLYIAMATPGSARFFFQSNRRDPAAFDLYEADAAQISSRLLMQSEGDVVNWLIDIDGRPGGRIRVDQSSPAQDRVLEILESQTHQWREVRRFAAIGYLAPLRLDRAHNRLIANSGLGRDTTALVSIDLANGQETELFRDALVDLTASYVQLGNTRPYAVQTDPDYPVVHYFDASLAEQLKSQLAPFIHEPIITLGAGTADLQLQQLIVRPITVRGAREFLFDRARQKVFQLTELHTPKPLLDAMVAIQPIAFQASDQLTIHGYLLRPRAAAEAQLPLPLVVSIHGGPWLRDFWAPAEPDNAYAGSQLLANRGYAVLHINYRGSAGYGGRHLYAAVKELHRRTQQDIEEGVRWAINQGIADPERIGLLGDSFGGYSVLQQMTQARFPYACGVDKGPPINTGSVHCATLSICR